jgi:hypothetical protein
LRDGVTNDVADADDDDGASPLTPSSNDDESDSMLACM